MVRGAPLKKVKDDNKEVLEPPVVPENINHAIQKKLFSPKGEDMKKKSF